MKSTQSKIFLAVAIMLSGGTGAIAGTITDSANSSIPINIIKKDSQWGNSKSSADEDMPYRGRAQQYSDERRLDDRNFDKNNLPRLKKKPVTEESVDVYVEQNSQRVGKKQASKPVTAKPVVKDTTRAVADSSSVCASVAKVWETTAFIAKTDVDKAVGSYKKLYKSCTNEKELIGTSYQVTQNVPQSTVEALVQDPIFNDVRLDDAKYYLQAHLVYEYNKQQNNAAILAMTNEMATAADKRKDSKLLSVLGWNAQRAQKYQAAETLFRAAVAYEGTGGIASALDGSIDSNQEGLVQSLLGQGKLIAADTEVAKLKGRALGKAQAQLMVAQAYQAYQDKDYVKTITLIDSAQARGAEFNPSLQALQAWAYKGNGNYDKAIVSFKELMTKQPETAEYSTGYVESVVAKGDINEVRALQKNPPAGLAVRAQNALADAYKAQGRTVKANALLGQPTESAATHVELDVVGKAKSGDKGQGRLSMTGPELTLGVKAGEATQIEVVAAKPRLSNKVDTVSGDEVRVAVTTDLGEDYQAKIGVGGSRVADTNKATFEANVRKYNQDGFAEVGVSREPVLDSVQSYAGTSYPVGGNGFRISGRAMDSKLSFNGSSAFHKGYVLDWKTAVGSISGTNFESTSYFDLKGSLLKTLDVKGMDWLAIGPEVRIKQAIKDQNRWEYGFAGAYTPLGETAGGLKATFLTQTGGTSVIKGAVFAGLVKKEFYNSSDTSVMLSAEVGGATILTDYIVAKGGLTVNSVSGYSDVTAHAGLDFSFDKRTKLTGEDVKFTPKIIK